MCFAEQGLPHPLLLTSPVTCHTTVGTRRREEREELRMEMEKCREERDEVLRGAADEDDMASEISDIH